MTDYSTLQSDIAEWAVRDDLAAKTPSFIRLAEAKINRRVRVMEMETAATLELTSGNSYEVDLPSGFRGFRSLYNTAARNPRMVYIEPERFHINDNSPNDAFSELRSGETPYTIERNKLVIDAPAGATDTITIQSVYYKALGPLSDVNTTNAVLTAHYDVYLYAGLAELWDYADELEMEAKYTRKFDRIVEEIGENERGRRRSAGANIRRAPDRRVV